MLPLSTRRAKRCSALTPLLKAVHRGGARRLSTLPSSFSAIVASSFGGPEVLKLASRQMAELPSLEAGQVLVEMHAAGVNPSDTYVRLGPHGPWAATPHLLPTLPFTPGKDGAGVVAAVGAGTAGALPVGSRVYTTGSVSGTYAEYAVCDAQHVRPLPDAVSFAQGACVGVPCATAHRALFTRGGAEAGDCIFVHGASGAVGLAAVQLAAARGCHVVGSASSAEGHAAVLGAGALAVVNHREANYLEEARAALPASSDGKFDIVLEMAAHANLVADLSLLRRGGQVCIVGSKAQAVELNPRLLMAGEASLRGIFLPSSTAEELDAIHAALFNEMARGTLTPVVAKQLALPEAPAAHEEVMSTQGKAGNVVLIARE